MSINSAMLSGVAGLVANSAALGAISDNIANVNTVGYKRNVTNFEDLVTQSASGGAYNSGGVLASTRQLIDQQGQLAQSTSATDLAIQGDGFFVTSATPNATGAADVSFTRAGSFVPDSSGYLRNAAGLYLQGWSADASGVITTNPSDLTKLSTINVKNVGNLPDPTTKASLNMTLNADQTVSAQEATYSAATPAQSMSAYTPTSGTGVKPDYTNSVTVYDAQGGAHTFQLDYLKSATANQWHVEVQAVPASDVAGTTNGQIAAGVLAFNADGTLDTTNTTLPANLTLAASSAGAGLRWAAPTGAAGTTSIGLPAQTIALNLSGAPASVSQYAGQASFTTSTSVDGGPSAALTGVTIDASGKVNASFSNGVTRSIAEVALATFQNADGLTATSGDAYRASINSGTFNLKSPGTAGAGDISAYNTESSTVDLSTEFTGLIITQRAYAASSKIITTADEMLQTLINSKQ